VGFVDPNYVFSFDLSIKFALMTIIGGIATGIGPFLGALLITLLEAYLRASFSGGPAGQSGIYLVIYGVALMLVVRFLPRGLVLELADRFRWRRRARRTEAQEGEQVAAGTH
jgi:branched-chain amino acid transport system permease protein